MATATSPIAGLVVTIASVRAMVATRDSAPRAAMLSYRVQRVRLMPWLHYEKSFRAVRRRAVHCRWRWLPITKCAPSSQTWAPGGCVSVRAACVATGLIKTESRDRAGLAPSS